MKAAFLEKLAYRKLFRLSHGMIWIGSVCIGTLASVPKILRLHIGLGELLVDISISSTFCVFVWYYNLYALSKLPGRPRSVRFLGGRLLKSLGIGIMVMSLFVLVHQLVFPQYHLESMAAMYEFRGLVINLTINLLLYLLYQNYVASTMNMELERAQAANLNIRFELLKQQVNPHFLFNSLNTLKSMVEMGDPNATRFIVILSEFYRKTLDSGKEFVVRLDEELDRLKAYVFLMEARFEGGFRLDIGVDDALAGSLIPAFTLQLLMENCFKHNVVSLARPLVVRIYSEPEFLVVENNLQPRRSVDEGARLGLENISSRYLQRFGTGITISKTDQIFSVKLPVIYADRNHRG